jgi:uncharacterized protein (TIGR02271 family)
MAVSAKRTIVGVFESHAKAQQAVAQLRQAGFRDDQIGVIARNVAAARDTDDDDLTGDNYAGEGAATGIAAGAGLGALWGMGIFAGLLPALGPAIAGGALATILTSAAAGAAAAGLAGALVGMGIPKEEAEYYQREFHAGRVLVTVTADGRATEAEQILRRNGGYDVATRPEGGERAPATHAASRTKETAQHKAGATDACTTAGGQQTIQAREEEIRVRRQPVESEVRVHKEVHTEHKTIEVPVTHEEVVVTRHPVSGHKVSDTEIGEGEELRIPVRDEQVHVEKQPVVTEEVTIGKRKVQEKKQVSGTVKKEEIVVEKKGNPNLKEECR